MYIFITSLLDKVIKAMFLQVLQKKRTRELSLSLLTNVVWFEKKKSCFFCKVCEEENNGKIKNNTSFCYSKMLLKMAIMFLRTVLG